MSQDTSTGLVSCWVVELVVSSPTVDVAIASTQCAYQHSDDYSGHTCTRITDNGLYGDLPMLLPLSQTATVGHVIRMLEQYRETVVDESTKHGRRPITTDLRVYAIIKLHEQIIE